MSNVDGAKHVIAEANAELDLIAAKAPWIKDAVNQTRLGNSSWLVGILSARARVRGAA